MSDQGSDPPPQKPSPPVQTGGSKDCLPGSLELRNPPHNILPLTDDKELDEHVNSFFDSFPCQLTMNVEEEAAETEYTDGMGKNVDVESLRIDAETELSPLGEKLENISGRNVESTSFTNAPAHDNESVSLEPEIGMEFASEEDVIKFYENYANRSGFKIRKGKVKRSSDGCVKTRYLLCSREGFRSKNPANTTTKYARKETRTGCNARIKVILKNEKWVISDICLQHNHDQESLAQTHKEDPSTNVSEVEKQPTEVDLVESISAPARWPNFFGLIRGFQEIENNDDFTVTSVIAKMKSDCHNTQTPENDRKLASESGGCQPGLKHLQNPSVLDLESQVKLCNDNAASSSKEVQPFYTNVDTESMKKFYTNLDSADQNDSSLRVSAHAQGKEQRELKIDDAIGLLRTLFKDKLSVATRSTYLPPLQAALSFLSSSTKESDLSAALKSVCLKLAGDIPSILLRYNQTKIIIDQFDNVNAAIDSINCKLTENKKMYLDLSTTRDAITLEIGEMEEQLNKLQAKVKEQYDLSGEIFKKMQSTHAEGASLKKEVDELERKVPAMLWVKDYAEKTRLELEDEWDKLGKLLDQNSGQI